MRRLLAIAAVSMVLSGCYTYRPAEYLAVQIGAPLVVVIIDEAVVPLAGKVRETWLASLNAADRAATDHITTDAVADGMIYCHHPTLASAYTVQLGACLPGAREITKATFETRGRGL